jgi:hypothetical protein
MRIFVEENLVGLKAYLKSKGYYIVNAGDKISSDVHIYSQTNIDFYSLESSILPCGEGSLIINADNLSFNEIEYMIKHRVYTPLFY